MKRLIITTSASGAGWLKRANVGDQVEALEHRLISGPLPTNSETTAFFAPREEALGHDISHWQRWISFARARELGPSRPGLIAMVEDFDAVELWIDPVPNAQLVLLELLDFLRPHREIVQKLVLRHANSRIAVRGVEDIAAWRPPAEQVDLHHLEIASLAWDAFRQGTPEAWYALLTEDLGALPCLHQTVLKLLEELPAVGTALGATEWALLKEISPGNVGPFDVFPGGGIPDVYDYWEIGASLDHLAHCAIPVVAGLDAGPFDMVLHDDRDRCQRYKNCKLALSELGRALVEDRADFSRFNPVHRWWGGTELSNDHLWRWDHANSALISPS